MNKQEIEWKDVVGFEKLYQVSNYGDIKRKDTGKELAKTKNNRGYYQVKLYKDGIGKSLKTHKVVAMAFIPNPNNLPDINHKDECKTNNAVDNLEWCTVKYNNTYGTARARAVKNSNYAEISKKRAIKQSKEVTQYDLDGNIIAVWANAYVAEMHGYTQDCICKCCNGLLQTHNGFIWKYTSNITQQLNNGWIPVSEPPSEYGTYIVAWMPTGHTADDIMKATKSKATHYYEILEYDPEEDDGWEEIKQYDSYKILAWRNLPEPYKEVSE